ncbi:MAG: N-acetylmuramoyl-L-alanine amidase [Ruminiclostridium sp.]|nr:N-acetylmuramoyl-L-alanine amidase [Ruminiclostridium sp.]
MGIVMHWTANPNATAVQNRNYFESRKNGTNGYGSAHYIIGTDGGIVQCVPESEVAYHCGSSQPDPESGRVYTDEARRRFGRYATAGSSPNHVTIGIELCPTDWAGNFTQATLGAAAELCADICTRHGLAPDDITTHHDVVGWKDCPLLWTRRPELLHEFRNTVRHAIEREDTGI